MTAAVIRYQRTGAGRRELLERVSEYAYRFPLWQNIRHDEDDCGDFYLYCQPRLQEAVDRFQDQGRPFEAYLRAVLTWQFSSYYRFKERRETAWRLARTPVLWDEEAAALAAGHRPPDPDTPDHDAPDRAAPDRATADQAAAAPHAPDAGPACLDDGVTRRRVVFAVLKNCHRLRDTQVSAWAGRCERADLPALIGRARRVSEGAQRRWRRLRERSNHAYARARLIEAQLRAETGDDRRLLLERRLRRARDAAVTSRAEARAVRLGPSNRQIAELLGIPKGTVDTGLFWLKRRFSPDRLRAT